MGYEAVAYSIAQGIYTVIPNYILISTEIIENQKSYFRLSLLGIHLS